MAKKDPIATDSGDAVSFLDKRGVLRPEDVLSDPAGETVFLPPAGELPDPIRAGPSKATNRLFWPDFSS